MVFRFTLALVTAAAGVVLVSLFWPLFSPATRPPVLESVREAVLSTGAGRQTAETLGISDDERLSPHPVNDMVASVAGTLMTAVGDKASEIVVGQAVSELTKQFKTLPPDQQSQLRQAICTQ
ncbi:hypothetical protein M1555_00690 [Patescibacteria group bacterium]|nr:hypothetical protein [Patescibacteria group bacterium]